jgi:hypothetical protein
MKASVFPGFLIVSKDKVLRAISRFRAPPRNCRKCQNRLVFAISFERGSAFKFGFEHSKAHVLEPRKQKEYLGLLDVHARGSARRAENRIDRQNLTRCPLVAKQRQTTRTQSNRKVANGRVLKIAC